MTGTELAAAFGRVARAVHWYLREVSGEADYDRYLARQEQLAGGGQVPVPGRPTLSGQVLSQREFERQRWTERSRGPGNRCC